MINANELRIGNLVITNDDKIVKVKNINDDGINGEWDSEWATFYHKWLKGIPLTPEILEKAGFEKIGSTNFENSKHIISFLVKMYDDHSILLAVKNEYEKCNVGIYKYLHQLQNLYFALIGEELQIKEFEAVEKGIKF